MKSYTQFVTKAHSHLSEAPYDWGSDPRWGFVGQLERQRRKAFGTDQEKAAAHSYERSVNDLSPGGRPRTGTNLPTYDQIQNRTRERRLADPNYPGKTKPTPTPTPTPAPTAPARDRMANASKEDRMAAWAKANPKLAAAKAERDRTRGTSATTNPLMKDMKSRLPAPKPAANAAKPAANVGAPGSQPKGEDLLTGPKPAANAAKPAANAAGAAKPAANVGAPGSQPKGEDLLTGPKPAARPAPTPARPAANVGAPGSQPKGEDLLTGPKPAARPAPTPARPAATGAARPAPTPARPAVTGAGNRTADLARVRRQAMLKTVSNSPNAQRIAARNPMVQRGIAAERGAVNQSIRNSVARANTPANLNRPAPAGTALAKQQARPPVVNRQTGGVQSVGAVGARPAAARPVAARPVAARPAAAKPTSGRGSGSGPAPTPKPGATLWESKMTKKTFSQFMEEAHNLNEALPLAIPLAMKLGSMALGAYSAYQAGKKLKKGDYKGAALDAVGALPVGRLASGIVRGVGAGKRLQQAAGIVGTLGKESVPNEKNKLINKAIDKGIDAVAGTPGQGSSTQAAKPAATPKPTTKPQQTSAQREAQARSTTTTTQTQPTTSTTTQTKPTSNTKDTEKKKPLTRMQSMQAGSRWV